MFKMNIKTVKVLDIKYCEKLLGVTAISIEWRVGLIMHVLNEY